MNATGPLQNHAVQNLNYSMSDVFTTITEAGSYLRVFFVSQPRTASRMISERYRPSSSATASSATRSCLPSINDFQTPQ